MVPCRLVAVHGRSRSVVILQDVVALAGLGVMSRAQLAAENLDSGSKGEASRSMSSPVMLAENDISLWPATETATTCYRRLKRDGSGK
jgi:hypothetical protein